MEMWPVSAVKDVMFDKFDGGTTVEEVEVNRGAAGARKAGSNTSPERNATGKVSGVDLNNSWPKFQNSLWRSELVLLLLN